MVKGRDITVYICICLRVGGGGLPNNVVGIY